MATTDPVTEASATILGKFGVAAQVTGTTVMVGAASKQYLGFSLDEWSLIGIISGIVLGGIGFITSSAITLYYKRKQDRREEAEHRLRMVLRRDQHELTEHGIER